jgi:hypothetical protein
MAQDISDKIRRIDTIEAVVIRCGCGDPATIHPGQPCPRPRRVSDLGVISYNDSARPFRSMIERARIWIRRKTQGE